MVWNLLITFSKIEELLKDYCVQISEIEIKFITKKINVTQKCNISLQLVLTIRNVCLIHYSRDNNIICSTIYYLHNQIMETEFLLFEYLIWSNFRGNFRSFYFSSYEKNEEIHDPQIFYWYVKLLWDWKFRKIYFPDRFYNQKMNAIQKLLIFLLFEFFVHIQFRKKKKFFLLL